MASFRKRAKGYQGTIYVGRDSDGTQLFEYVTKPTLKECKAAAREIEDEIEKGTFIKIKNILVVDAIKEWIELKRGELSPSTIHLYKNAYLNAHYKPFFKNLKLRDIVGNELLIRKFKAKLLKELHSNTVRKILSVLNKICRETLRDKNPCKFVELPPKKKGTRKVPNDAEFLQIHHAVLGTIDEPIILLAGWCGLRLGEICALKPNDIYKEKGIIKIDESMAINDNYKYESKDPKSDNGIREIAVPEYLMELINSTMVKQKKIPERIFNYLPNSYSQRFNRIIKKNNLPPVSFHALRHYHLTWLFENGFPDQYAANRAGHDIQTLKSIYQHLGLERKKKFDDNIRGMLSPSLATEDQGKKQDSSK